MSLKPPIAMQQDPHVDVGCMPLGEIHELMANEQARVGPSVEMRLHPNGTGHTDGLYGDAEVVKVAGGAKTFVQQVLGLLSKGAVESATEKVLKFANQARDQARGVPIAEGVAKRASDAAHLFETAVRRLPTAKSTAEIQDWYREAHNHLVETLVQANEAAWIAKNAGRENRGALKRRLGY